MTLPSYAMNQSSFGEMYEARLVGPLFRPWADDALDAVGLAAGERLLDVACGTGIVARRARERLGDAVRVAGVDRSGEMLPVARAADPAIDWREASAEALPFGDASFDAVVCQQGMQFFADRAAAAREMRRVLAPGGRVAVATWRSLDETPFFRDLYETGVRHLGPFTDARHALGDAGELRGLLAGAGFRDVRVRTVSKTIRFADGRVLSDMNAMAMVGLSGAAARLSDDERARVLRALEEEGAAVLPRYADGGGIAFELATNLATAVV